MLTSGQMNPKDWGIGSPKDAGGFALRLASFILIGRFGDSRQAAFLNYRLYGL
jgi:hypothetical protein